MALVSLPKRIGRNYFWEYIKEDGLEFVCLVDKGTEDACKQTWSHYKTANPTSAITRHFLDRKDHAKLDEEHRNFQRATGGTITCSRRWPAETVASQASEEGKQTKINKYF